jgi:hypothetical protein
MVKDVMVYTGSAIAIIWGIAHLAPTRSIVTGMKNISRDDKMVFKMEWIAEGLALMFLGVLVLLINILHGIDNPVTHTVFRLSAIMLLVMAALTAFTGARTKVIFFKICPAVKTVIAALVIIPVYI